jgi:hypothetical protein
MLFRIIAIFPICGSSHRGTYPRVQMIDAKAQIPGPASWRLIRHRKTRIIEVVIPTVKRTNPSVGK